MAKKSAPAVATTKPVKNTEIPRVHCGDGLLRPAWKTIEDVDDEKIVVYYVRPGSPIAPCRHCFERVISIVLVRGDDRKWITVEDDYSYTVEMNEPRTEKRPALPASNPLWVDFWDQYYRRHACIEYKVWHALWLTIAATYLILQRFTNDTKAISIPGD